MAGAQQWLLSVLTVCVLCALAQAVMPPGPVKGVGRLVCGLVLLCTVLSPLPGLDLEGNTRWLEGWLEGLEEQKRALEQQVGEERKVIIEESYAAYIVDKAEELGLTCTAQVFCREEAGLYLPHWTEVSSPDSQEAQQVLSQFIRQDLGVPLARQSYINQGEERSA